MLSTARLDSGASTQLVLTSIRIHQTTASLPLFAIHLSRQWEFSTNGTDGDTNETWARLRWYFVFAHFSIHSRWWDWTHTHCQTRSIYLAVVCVQRFFLPLQFFFLVASVWVSTESELHTDNKLFIQWPEWLSFFNRSLIHLTLVHVLCHTNATA